MDCNKDEAEKAKVIAEGKMFRSEFAGALKFLLKAQHLFPSLENLQQMVAICEVHCSAEKRRNGVQDWYSVFQIQPDADADAIKKQHRKLLLLLHPDKNPFPGAEAAFKLVMEAKWLFSDEDKRARYDKLYSANATKYPDTSFTYWTCCNHCWYMFEFRTEHKDWDIPCPRCRGIFAASHVKFDAVPPSPESETADESPASSEAGTYPECDVFEAERRVENFAVNQVWSIFDSRDGMPRRYVRVKRVFDAEFRLQVTYLVPKDNKCIPVACGRFKNGETKDVEDHSIFSSQIIHEFCKRYDKIYPRRGEIWAVFREWSDEWRTSLEKHKLPYKYDLVEILSDYKDVDAGIGVAYMRKLEGFDALFHRKVQCGVCEIQIPSTEMLRFSHKVPAVKVTKKNKESVPDNSYEVDIAAVPEDTSQVDSADPEAAKVDDKVKRKRRKNKDDSGSNENLEGFRIEQIWATYSLVTDLPTEYVRIKTIIPRPELMIHVIGLEPFTKPLTRHGSCGDFKLKAGRPSILSRTRFSHQVKPVYSNKSRVKVYPRKDEIWALYKNDDSREFDIVVVMEDYSDGREISEVAALTAKGSRHIFQTEGSISISKAEMCKRFSHQIPATASGVEGGINYWELEPKAIPRP